MSNAIHSTIEVDISWLTPFSLRCSNTPSTSLSQSQGHLEVGGSAACPRLGTWSSASCHSCSTFALEGCKSLIGSTGRRPPASSEVSIHQSQSTMKIKATSYNVSLQCYLYNNTRLQPARVCVCVCDGPSQAPLDENQNGGFHSSKFRLLRPPQLFPKSEISLEREDELPGYWIWGR